MHYLLKYLAKNKEKISGDLMDLDPCHLCRGLSHVTSTLCGNVTRILCIVLEFRAEDKNMDMFICIH